MNELKVISSLKLETGDVLAKNIEGTGPKLFVDTKLEDNTYLLKLMSEETVIINNNTPWFRLYNLYPVHETEVSGLVIPEEGDLKETLLTFL